MRRRDAIEAIYPDLEAGVVVTIMGAVAAELQSIGHKANFFYLQHAMGLASSMGLGIALCRPDLPVVVFDGDGSLLMLISARGEFGERDPWQTEGGGVTSHVLTALRIPFRHLSRADDVQRRIAQAQTLAYSASRPVALLLQRDLMWEEA